MAILILNGVELPEFMEEIRNVVNRAVSENSSQAVVQKEILTPDEVCEFLSISKSTLYKYTKSKKLTSWGIGDKVYYNRSEILSALKPLN